MPRDAAAVRPGSSRLVRVGGTGRRSPAPHRPRRYRSGEEAESVGEAVLRRPGDLPAPRLRRGSPSPRPAAAPMGSGRASPARMRTAGRGARRPAEHPVVEGLLVDGVGTASRNSVASSAASGWRGWRRRPLLALAEHPGQHRERRRHPAPQVAGIRVGPTSSSCVAAAIASLGPASGARQ